MSVAAGVSLVFGVALLAALVVTPAARALARRLGVVARPAADRWHSEPTALLGGVSLVLAMAAGVAVGLLPLGSSAGLRVQSALLTPALGVVAGALIMFVVGIVDDVTRLRPQVKFLLQMLAGLTMISFGAVFPITPWYVLNLVATLFWFVAVTNAFNLLDNMDGIAAGIGAIASIFLGIAFIKQGAGVHAVLACALAGAAVGFVRYNFHPATIFLGDAGSLFMGALLAGLVVSSHSGVSGSFVSVLFVPVMIIAVPILDTGLVMVTRTLAGRAISQGGRDHSTHRLVALGLEERQVAVLLYVFSVAGGLVALGLTGLDRGLRILLGSTFLAALCLFAAYLARMHVYQPAPGNAPRRMTLLVANLLYKRRLAEILLDCVLVALAYYGAYRLRFDGALPPDYVAAFQSTLGLVVAVKVLTFTLFGVYRGSWQYTSLLDLYRVIGAIVASSTLLLLFGQWQVPELGASHSLVYIDALLAAALVLSSRISVRSLDLLRRSLQSSGESVLIYGAGDGGEMALRELLNNKGLALQPVCFLDDDVRKHGAQVHGVPIVGGAEMLAHAVDRFGVSKILIGTKKLSPKVLLALESFAAERGLELIELDIQFRKVVSVAKQPGVHLPPERLQSDWVEGPSGLKQHATEPA